MPVLYTYDPRKLLCFFFAFICINASAQLHADFTSNVQQGCSPLVVQFSDISTGNPDLAGYFWDLGNGAISTQRNPGAIYINPGTYSVSLHIKKGTAKDSVIKTNYITVYADPVADFTADPMEGCAPLNVSFNDSSKAGSGVIAGWIWDFGDGIISTVQNPQHTYNISDTFNVVLTVTNSFGCKKTLQQQSFIRVGGSITADFNYTYSNVCQPPSTVTFTNASQSNKILNYQWLFGDGLASTDDNPVHVYTTSGNFTVQLIALTASGCTDTTEQVISIGSEKADFDFTNACVNEPAVFTDNSTPRPLSEIWDFGDGNTDTGFSVAHVYQTSGSFQVTLTANFGGCTDVIKKTIKTATKAYADFTVPGKLSTCVYPVAVQFNNTSQGAVGYKWFFDDGTVSSAVNPLHVFTKPGTYTVALIAFSASGCSDTLIKDDFIKIGPPEISGIANLPFEGCAPQTIEFKPTINSGVAISSYQWDFGDSSTATDSMPTHHYQNPGIYNVGLIVTTEEGCTDTLLMPNAISLGKAPTPFFSANPLDVCAETPVQFIDSSIGIVTNRLWLFGDGSASTAVDPPHIYTDTGYFTVTLIVSQYGCYDTLTRNSYIHVQSPVAAFSFFSRCSDPYTYNFVDNSIDPKTWLWDFGDGSTSTKQYPTHTYSSTGAFNISLTVKNGSCSYTKHDSLSVIQEDPSFKYQFLSSNFCKYDSVKFTATNYDSGYIKIFQWDFGDGTSTNPTPNADVVYHLYNDAGTYKPLLIVKDENNCIDTINKNVQIKVFGPNAAFANKSGDCLFSTIDFTDESFSDGVHAIKTWIWDYGDNTKPDTLTSPPFAHTYETSGLFDVSLKIIDKNNCYDTITNIQAVNITQPIADFFATDTLSCSGSPIQFNDQSQGVSMAYYWNFGDGQTSANPDPLHFYVADGLYDIKLVLKDKYGCTDSITKPQYIRVSDPVAGFILTDSLFLCPPAKVDPQNTSLNYSELLWDFGDGNSSSETAPEHYYTSSGTYTLQLTVKGYGNCFAIFSKPVILKGPSAKLTYSPFTGCDSLNVSFSAKAESTIKYIWDFGNGVTEVSTDSAISYTYLTYGIFLPQLVIVDSGGCRVPIVNPDTIMVFGAKAKFSVNQLPGSCDSSLYEFTDSSTSIYDKIASHYWQFGDGNTSSVKNPDHYYHNASLYNTSLEITTEKGCRSNYALPVDVRIDSTPQIFATVPDSACVNSPVPLTAGVMNNSPANFAWAWDLGNGDHAHTYDTLYSYTNPGFYNVYVSGTSVAGCSDTAMFAIHINPLPTTYAGPDSTICKGQSINLAATGASTYTWVSDASLSCLTCSNPVANPLVNTTYYLTGINSHGCIASDSINILVKQPANVSIEAPDTICVGTTIQLKATGAEQYTWQPASLVTSSTDSITSSTPPYTTTYLVIGTDSKSCFSDTASAVVNVFPIPTVQIVDSIVTVEAGDQYQITTTGSADITSWLWTPALGLSCSDCPNPIAKPAETQDYKLNVHNLAGCSAEEGITIVVSCKDQNLFIPNTFSPNADGMNDFFYPRGKGIFSIKSFRVFNRWGTLVYERMNFPPNQQTYGWDGTYKGQAVQTDVYIFIVEVVCTNGKVISSKGNVTLLH